MTSLKRKIIDSTDYAEIAGALAGQFVHATNSSFMKPATDGRVKTLAGFRFVQDKGLLLPDHTIAVLTNTDDSLRLNGKTEFEPAHVRLAKAFDAVCKNFPQNSVIGGFHAEATPQELYNVFGGVAAEFTSLHKWGYATLGTDNDETIAGADRARHVFAFLLPGNERPANMGAAPRGIQNNVHVRDLYQEADGLGPYLSQDDRLLFDAV